MDPGNAGAADLKAVAETDVLAYYLLRTDPFYDEARSFWRFAQLLLQQVAIESLPAARRPQ